MTSTDNVVTVEMFNAGIEGLKSENRSIIDGFQCAGEQIELIDSDYEQTTNQLSSLN